MAQTVLYEVLKSYTTSIAPFVCHTAEEIYDNYKHLTFEPQSSIFKTGWISCVRLQNKENKRSDTLIE